MLDSAGRRIPDLHDHPGLTDYMVELVFDFLTRREGEIFQGNLLIKSIPDFKRLRERQGAKSEPKLKTVLESRPHLFRVMPDPDTRRGTNWTVCSSGRTRTTQPARPRRPPLVSPSTSPSSSSSGQLASADGVIGSAGGVPMPGPRREEVPRRRFDEALNGLGRPIPDDLNNVTQVAEYIIEVVSTALRGCNEFFQGKFLANHIPDLARLRLRQGARSNPKLKSVLQSRPDLFRVVEDSENGTNWTVQCLQQGRNTPVPAMGHVAALGEGASSSSSSQPPPPVALSGGDWGPGVREDANTLRSAPSPETDRYNLSEAINYSNRTTGLTTSPGYDVMGLTNLVRTALPEKAHDEQYIQDVANVFSVHELSTFDLASIRTEEEIAELFTFSQVALSVRAGVRRVLRYARVSSPISSDPGASGSSTDAVVVPQRTPFFPTQPQNATELHFEYWLTEHDVRRILAVREKKKFGFLLETDASLDVVEGQYARLGTGFSIHFGEFEFTSDGGGVLSPDCVKLKPSSAHLICKGAYLWSDDPSKGRKPKPGSDGECVAFCAGWWTFFRYMQMLVGRIGELDTPFIGDALKLRLVSQVDNRRVREVMLASRTDRRFFGAHAGTSAFIKQTVEKSLRLIYKDGVNAVKMEDVVRWTRRDNLYVVGISVISTVWE